LWVQQGATAIIGPAVGGLLALLAADAVVRAAEPARRARAAGVKPADMRLIMTGGHTASAGQPRRGVA
jgi:hypothetical protein